MTREEALSYFKRRKDMGLSDTCQEAEDVAIQALFAEACEDAVSRQAVLVAIRNQYPGIPFVDVNGARRKWAEKYAQYRECEKIIESFPSVQPVRPKGKWIYQEGHFPVMWKCSECRMMWGLHTDYCPVCGAKMETEE